MGELSDDELKERSQQMIQSGPNPGSIFRHYKGALYTVVALSLDENTLVPLVTYRSNKTGTYWTRTLEDWGQDVWFEDFRGGPSIPVRRFTPVPD